MRTLLFTLVLGTAAVLGSAKPADAEFAGTSDYLYTVYYGESTTTSMSFMDAFYDYALYVESPNIPGHWQHVETFSTLAEAEFWEQMFSSSFETSIVPIYNPLFQSRYSISRNSYLGW